MQKLFLCIQWRQTGSWGIAPLLILAIDGGEWSAWVPGHLPTVNQLIWRLNDSESSLCTPWSRLTIVVVKLFRFWTSILLECGPIWSAWHPVTFYSCRKIPRVHCTGSFVGPTVVKTRNKVYPCSVPKALSSSTHHVALDLTINS